jgi:hypothetical protein
MTYKWTHMTMHDTVMEVAYDCGFTITVPLVLAADQTLLHAATLGDQMLMLADRAHDQECQECR